MRRPIMATASVMLFIVVLVNINHDFMDGSYSGPYWLAPIDFILTQCTVALIGWRLWVAYDLESKGE